MNIMSKCGIYYIQNIITKQVYIGQSVDIDRRKQKHIYDLRNNKHQNTHMQNSFNKYGEDNFEFGIIRLCDKSQLDELEIAYMELYNAKKEGFNICDGGVNICPDNSNENHGLWRHDISNNNIKEMYLGDYNSKQIAELLNCSRRTINRRLKKIFGDEYDVIKRQKQLKALEKVDYKNPNILDEDILYLANNGLNSVEIASKLSCSDSTVMSRLRGALSKEDYENYKKLNTNRKLAKIREKAHTKESIKKIADKHKKYTLWDGSKAHYMINKSLNDWNNSFYLRYNSRDVKIGKFIEFISPILIHDLIVKFNK